MSRPKNSHLFSAHVKPACVLLCVWHRLLFQNRSNFAFLLVHHLILFDNLVLIFCPLYCNYALSTSSPCFAQKLQIPLDKSESRPLDSICPFSQTQLNSLFLPSENCTAIQLSCKYITNPSCEQQNATQTFQRRRTIDNSRCFSSTTNLFAAYTPQKSPATRQPTARSSTMPHAAAAQACCWSLETVLTLLPSLQPFTCSYHSISCRFHSRNVSSTTSALIIEFPTPEVLIHQL